MKRFLLSILMVVIGLTAFSQSPSRIISLQPAYPLVVGESSAGGVSFDSNALSLTDTPLDSLPSYEIGQIFEQTVRCYAEDGHGFYVKADSLHSLNVVYSYELKEGNEPPKGAIEFNETTGRFKYFPAVDDYKSFAITFSATNGTETITEDVVFSLMPKTPSEMTIFQSEGNMPDAGDYITIVVDNIAKPMYLNNLERPVCSISIAGKDIVFDKNVSNKVSGLSGREDIYELNIYAERLIVRSALKFPQTDITVYAKELIFEDKNGVTASINTSPTSEKSLTDGQGTNGGNAGNITLNVKEMKANMALRFVLNGADGQSTNRNGIPGNGGNGGIVRSTIDISSFCDMERGSGGVRYDVATDGSNNAGSVIGYGTIGKSGCFELINNPYAYLHPYYISAVIRHANDAFINNCLDYTLQTCREYHALIDEYQDSNYFGNGGQDEGSHDWGDILGRRRSNTDYNGTETGLQAGLDWGFESESDKEVVDCKLELQNDLLEINNMLFRLEQGLDYFGNPVGWVPLLSFEAYLKNYDSEIDRAIPTLYMYYWLSRIDQTLQHKVQACEFAANTTEQEINSNTELLNSLVLEIPVLQDEADALSAMIEDLTVRIEALQNQLLAQAIKSVKRKHWLKNLFGIGSAVAKVVSFVPGWGTAVGSGLNLALNIASTGLDYSEGSNYFSSAMNMINTDDMISEFNDMKQNLTNAQTSVGQNDLNGLFSACNSFLNSGKKLADNLNNAYNVISNNQVSNSEVQAEYNKLIANSPEWNRMKGDIDKLNIKKTELLNHMNDVFSNMTNTMSELSNDVLALDAFKRDVFTGNSMRDLNAMLYIEKMEQRAKNRLLLYDYYLRKAYEYRLLKPYEGEEFNLGSMYDRFETLGMALDSVVDVSAYNTLSSVYRERISDMTHRIIEEYTYSQPEKTSTPRTYRIPKDKLDALNTNGSVTLNMYEMGFFSPTEENIRISDFGVSYIKAHSEGEPAYWGELSLEMSHSGISKFRKDGQTYWFNHMSTGTKNPHFWTTKIDINSLPEVKNPETDKNSVAISSLLSSILNYNTENVMLFSRPSVWSDITLTKSVLTDTEEDILIDSLVLKLSYDYTRRTENVCNIDISTSDDLMPYIACSEKDFCGRSGGRGKLFRSYKKSSGSVTFTAVEKYETYYFVNWTSRAGKVVSDKLELKVGKDKDQFYIANYERRVPVLNVPDTIFVGYEGGTYNIDVKNVGSGETEMDWYVEDSLKTFVSLDGVAEGIDDGSFTFTYEANYTNSERVDTLIIYAPECDVMSKMIYVVQKALDPDHLTEVAAEKIKVYPNPARDYVKIEGANIKSVQLYSIAGQEISSVNADGKNYLTIDISHMLCGMYMFVVNTNNVRICKKVLKAY